MSSNLVAFVAGATGFTGRAVVEVLRIRSVKTIAHIRPDSPSRGRFEEELASIGAIVDETPWTEEAMSHALRASAPDMVFSLLGTTRARARSEGRSAKEAYEAVDHGLSVLLLRAAETCEKAPRFIYLSSIGADGGRGSYMAARKKVEDRLQKSALPWMVARPSFITGSRDEPRPAERVAAAMADGILAALGSLGAQELRERYRSTSNRALAERLVDLAFDPSAVHAVFEGASLRRK